MSERLIIVTGERDRIARLMEKAEQLSVLGIQYYQGRDEPGRDAIHLLVDNENRQGVLDDIQNSLGGGQNWRISILPVEATIPVPETENSSDNDSNGRAGESREELHADAIRNSRLNAGFFVFVALSTMVAAIGLIENNVAVVIGAMVIAPLLGPNLAFAVGVALGDWKLMGRAALTNLLGVALTLVICVAAGMGTAVELNSAELLARTQVGFDGIALALASGAAAALSLSTGLSTTLIGVMVAVALLPPAATLGLMAGRGEFEPALGAALLLAVNVVCVNLAAQFVFVIQGITPRTWFEKKNARRAVVINFSVWLSLLAALVALLFFRTPTF